ncbi:hypothetical protein [Nitratifractor sp.]
MNFIPFYALASTPSASIIGGMDDRSECSTHLTGAPTFRLGLRGFATLRPLLPLRTEHRHI